MFYMLANLRIRHVGIADDVETFGKITIAKFQESSNQGRMAIDTHCRRVELLARSESLIFQHVGVTAALAVSAENE